MLYWFKLVYAVIWSCKKKEKNAVICNATSLWMKKGAASRSAVLIGEKVMLNLPVQEFLHRLCWNHSHSVPFRSVLLRCTYLLWLCRLWTVSVELLLYAWGVVVAGKEIYSQVVLLLQTDSDYSSTLVMFSAFVFPSAFASLPGPAAEKQCVIFAVRHTYRLVWWPKSSMFVCKDLLPVGLGIALFPDPHLYARGLKSTGIIECQIFSGLKHSPDTAAHCQDIGNGPFSSA